MSEKTIGLLSVETKPLEAAVGGVDAEKARVLAAGWRAKGLHLSLKYHGQVGDALKALFETCAEELEELARG